jgi:hypothetical protein
MPMADLYSAYEKVHGKFFAGALIQGPEGP